ncbi:cold-shock protein [Telmatospirillum sp. J64-1]|uniref:cold-shock protein n=1 Tax=Telmatospirillum sp. J64-1 TaxID=2502183 RepID=UPI00272B0ED9|nr:cold shock domain-containing protein [Telmatospirillum sp. J64-1]
MSSFTLLSGKSRAPRTGEQARARVKWFNTDKGFGFVAPIGGDGDAFIHLSALQRIGLSSLPEGVEILCEIGQGPKGAQVLQIIEIDSTTLPPPVPQPEGPSLFGNVKWFASAKGFGFISADDGGKDVFIHKTVLRRCGLGGLGEGQRVQVVTAPTERGREATWIAPV